MALNWKTYAGLRPAGCLPCCSSTPAPTVCACALLIPPTVLGLTSPYASYSDAATAIANHVATSTTPCVMYAGSSEGSEGQLDTYTIDVAADIDIALASSTYFRGRGIISITLEASETLTIAAAVSTNGTIPGRPAFVGASLYACDGTLIDSGVTTGSASAASDTFVLTATTAGVYMLLLEGGGAGDATVFSLTDNITMSGGFVVNPVIALWDDSGTTRQLEACPKLYLPTLTEDTGTWYASCTDAFNAMDGLTASCIAFTDIPLVSISTFTASFSSSLAVNFASGTSGQLQANFWCSLNAVATKTLTMTVSLAAGTIASVTMLIYDYTGTLIETVTAGSSPITSSALPYTGRYIVYCNVTRNTGISGIDATFDVSSSGTISVNTIQALYDVSLSCPARLECGDTC